MLNVKPVKKGTTTRMSFGKIEEVMEMPNLIEVQKNSYKWFLDTGLKEVFRDIAEITDYTGNWVLTFIDYRIDEKTKHTVQECKERDATYAAPMRVTVRLLNKETGAIKESEVFMGEFPIMTDSGTFVINGGESHRLPARPFAGRIFRYDPRQDRYRAVLKHNQPQPRRMA